MVKTACSLLAGLNIEQPSLKVFMTIKMVTWLVLDSCQSKIAHVNQPINPGSKRWTPWWWHGLLFEWWKVMCLHEELCWLQDFRAEYTTYGRPYVNSVRWIWHIRLTECWRIKLTARTSDFVGNAKSLKFTIDTFHAGFSTSRLVWQVVYQAVQFASIHHGIQFFHSNNDTSTDGLNFDEAEMTHGGTPELDDSARNSPVRETFLFMLPLNIAMDKPIASNSATTLAWCYFDLLGNRPACLEPADFRCRWCQDASKNLRTIIYCRWWLNQMNLFYEIGWLAASHSPKAFWKSVKVACVTTWGTARLMRNSSLRIGPQSLVDRDDLVKTHKVLKEPLVENFENQFFGFPCCFLSTVQPINQATNEACPVVRQALSLYGSDLFLARQPSDQGFQRIFIASCDEWLRMVTWNNILTEGCDSEFDIFRCVGGLVTGGIAQLLPTWWT